MFARGLAVGIFAGASACAASIAGYLLLQEPTTEHQQKTTRIEAGLCSFLLAEYYCEVYG